VTPGTRMADERDQGRRPVLRVVAGGAGSASRRPQDPGASGARGDPIGASTESPRIRAVDEGLLAAFLVGDDEAMGELFRRHEALVLAIVRRYARNPEDARDLAQRTFLRALEASRRTLRRGPAAVPFRRWLVRVAVNLAKNHLRDESRFSRAPLEALGAAEGEPPAAAEALLHAERAARMRREVLRLPRRQREVLTLRLDAELPFAEIALALGITENAAKVTFHHASRRLREVLSEETP
jgi:RNA polymerase sigma-70 factor (ECF subfamily)